MLVKTILSFSHFHFGLIHLVVHSAAIEHPALHDIERLNIDASVVNRDGPSGINE